MTELTLEPLGPRHVAPIADLVRDPAVLRFTRVPDPPPEGFAESWLARYEAGRADGTREGFAVLERGRFAGLALAPTIDRTAQEAELGYVIAPHARGSWSLSALTDWAFRDLGLVRVQLYISADNEASKRVAVKCGYVREGVLRSAYVKPGLREDTELWSRLATD
jgi:RimJ/RimL family protein N-acetyltransferase